MTSEERKAVSFVGVLLVLAFAARSLSKPRPMEIHAGAVDVAALRAAGEAMQQEPQKKGRGRKRPATTTESKPTEPSAPKVWTVPGWRNPRPLQRVIISDDPAVPARSDGKVEINHASAREIESLPGVGPAMARRIIARRDSVGGFRKIEDLDPVRGIGPSLLAKLKPLVILN